MNKIKLKSKKPYISIIIPLFNEEGRINKLSKIYKYFNSLGVNYEVILINDGSTDRTLKEIAELPKDFKFILISYLENLGKGFAIKQGMLKANGEYLLFTDIDLSAPINEFDKFLPVLNKKTIAIGSRKTKGSRLTKHQSFIRESLGKGFTKLSRITLNLEITDFTCGFKCFPKKAAREIFSRQKIKRWGFDSEILFLANKLGYKIAEVPIKWSNDPRSRVKFPQDIFTSLIDLFAIRYNATRYKK